jgi:hypothetical protein
MKTERSRSGNLNGWDMPVGGFPLFPWIDEQAQILKAVYLSARLPAPVLGA